MSKANSAKLQNTYDKLEILGGLEDLKIKLYQCKIETLEQCEKWLEFYRWFHDEIKQLVVIDETYKNLEDRILIFQGWLFSSNPNHNEELNLAFGINLRDPYVPIDLSKSFFDLSYLNADDKVEQYLYARALDYFVKQNFSDGRTPIRIIPSKDSNKFVEFRNSPFNIELSPVLFENGRYWRITNTIMQANKNKLPNEPMFAQLKDGIKPQGSITYFDTVLDKLQNEAKKLVLHK